MSNYTIDSENIYFLNDKNLVSSLTGDATLNAIPTQQLFKTTYDDLSSADSFISRKINTICTDLSVKINTICTDLSIKINNICTDISSNIGQLCTEISTDLSGKYNTLTSNFVHVSGDTMTGALKINVGNKKTALSLHQEYETESTSKNHTTDFVIDDKGVCLSVDNGSSGEESRKIKFYTQDSINAVYFNDKSLSAHMHDYVTSEIKLSDDALSAGVKSYMTSVSNGLCAYINDKVTRVYKVQGSKTEWSEIQDISNHWGLTATNPYTDEHDKKILSSHIGDVWNLIGSRPETPELSGQNYVWVEQTITPAGGAPYTIWGWDSVGGFTDFSQYDKIVDVNSKLNNISTVLSSDYVEKDAYWTNLLSNELSTIAVASIKNLKFKHHIQPGHYATYYSSLHDMFSKLGLWDTDNSKILNGAVIEAHLNNNDEIISVGGYELSDFAVGNGDYIIIHSHNDQNYVNLSELSAKGLITEKNVYLIKAGISRYEFEQEIKARKDADTYLCSNLSNYVYEKTLNYNEISTIENIANEAGKDHWNIGDIIIKRCRLYENTSTLSDTFEYTSYVYTQDDVWKAMDGNYDASNVFFNKNFTFAGPYINIGNLNKQNENIISVEHFDCNLTDLFNKMFSVKENPTIKAYPILQNYQIKNGVYNFTTYYEVGTKITPILTSYVTRGFYTPWNILSTGYNSYRQNPTGISSFELVLKDSYSHIVTGSINTSDNRTGSQLTGNTNNVYLLSSINEFALSAGKNYTLTCNVTYNTGNYALDNEGNATAIRINSSTLTSSVIFGTSGNTVIPYYKAFYGAVNEKMTFIKDNDYTALRKNLTIKSANSSTLTTNGFSFTVSPNTAHQIIIVLPQEDNEWKLNVVKDTTANATLDMGNPTSIKIKDNNGDGTLRAYNVYTYDSTPEYGAHNITVTLKK